MKTAMNALLHVTIVDGSSDSFLVTFRILSRLNGIVDSENLDYGLSIRSPLPKDKFFVVNFFLSIQNTFYVHGASIKLFQVLRLNEKLLASVFFIVCDYLRSAALTIAFLFARNRARRFSYVVTMNDIIYSRLD